MSFQRVPQVLVCFSHLRWKFVFQRPQHILTRASRHFPVVFIEDPLLENGSEPHLKIETISRNLRVVTPVIPEGYDHQPLLDELYAEFSGSEVVAWFYTPMAIERAANLHADVIVYDCMDELSAFKFAPPQLVGAEKRLLNSADVVFTGGRSLYEAKSALHHNIHCFPSAVDQGHFAQALHADEAKDQKSITGPRLGFFGVIDERFDTDLLDQLATLKPDWSFVMIGPVVKIDPASLPQRPNIHWLGGRDYKDLPSYLAGWDVAIMPFALNESTRFISPTKTPEFLSAGLQVISTPIRDVVSPYGDLGLVEIATDAKGFAEAATRLLQGKPEAWKQDVARFLNGYDWDNTWARMHEKVLTALLKKKRSDHVRSAAKGLSAGQVEIAHNA